MSVDADASATASLRSVPGRRVSKRVTGFLAGAAILSSAFISHLGEIGANIYVSDLLLVAILAVGLPAVLIENRRSSSGRLARRVAACTWLLAVGYLVPLLGIGITGGAVEPFVKNVLPPILLVCLVVLLEERGALIETLCRWWTAVGAVVALFVIVLSASSAFRSSGATFDSPNYAAHFLCVAALVCFYARLSKLVKLAALIVFAVAILRTGSFVSVVLLAGFFGYRIWQRLDHWQARTRVAGHLAIVLAGVLLAINVVSNIGNAAFEYGFGLDSARLQRSYDSRLEFWREGVRTFADHPVGVGPGGLEVRTDIATDQAQLELHNDALDQLAQGGLLAVVAVVGILFIIWRAAPTGGMTRTLLTGLVFASITHQTWNFRHLWLAVGLALALDWTRNHSQQPSSAASNWIGSRPALMHSST